ncbi:hypothetical protein GCM10009534_19800 [Kribbella sandramycini]
MIPSGVEQFESVRNQTFLLAQVQQATVARALVRGGVRQPKCVTFCSQAFYEAPCLFDIGSAAGPYSPFGPGRRWLFGWRSLLQIVSARSGDPCAPDPALPGDVDEVPPL